MKSARRKSVAIVATLVASFLIGVAPAGAGSIGDPIDQEACDKAIAKLGKYQGKFLDAKVEGDKKAKKKYKKKIRRAEKKVDKKCGIPETER